MKRHEYLIPFSRFHRSILFLALIAKENAPKVKGYPEQIEDKINYALDFYENQLVNHFETEKREVFDVFRNKDSQVDQLLNEIELERKEIVNLFEKLMKVPDNHTLFFEIGERLEKHVRKEERELFQTIQENLKL